jgi:hypothetical protein
MLGRHRFLPFCKERNLFNIDQFGSDLGTIVCNRYKKVMLDGCSNHSTNRAHGSAGG